MKRRGLSGDHAIAICEGPQLRVRGERSGEFAVSASMVSRMLVGAQASKRGPVYKTHIWRSDEDERLSLQPFQGDDGYGDVVRIFAGAVERAAGPGRVQTGSRRRDALLVPVAFGIVGSLLVTFGWIEMADRPLWEPMIPTSIFLAIEALFVWDCVSSRWPRMANLDTLAPHLPR